jgi:hypothetical protein
MRARSAQGQTGIRGMDYAPVEEFYIDKKSRLRRVFADMWQAEESPCVVLLVPRLWLERAWVLWVESYRLSPVESAPGRESSSFVDSLGGSEREAALADAYIGNRGINSHAAEGRLHTLGGLYIVRG